MNTALKILSNYSRLSDKARRLLSFHIEELSVNTGDKICLLAEPTTHMYFANTGTFHVKKQNYSKVNNYIIRAQCSSFIHFDAYKSPATANVEITALDNAIIEVLPYHAFEILAFENAELNRLYTRLLCIDFRAYSSQLRNKLPQLEPTRLSSMRIFMHHLSKIAASIM